MAGRGGHRSDRRARPFRPCPRALRRACANRRPGMGRARRRSRPDGGRPQRRADPVRVRRFRLRGAGRRASDLRLLGPQCGGELAQRGADDLQDLRRLGEPRRLDAAVGADPGDLRGAGGRVRPLAAAEIARRRARRAGAHQRRLPALHPPDLEPVRAPVRPRRSRGATSTRSFRTPASRSTRRCSISAMSASRSSSRSPPRR